MQSGAHLARGLYTRNRRRSRDAELDFTRQSARDRYFRRLHGRSSAMTLRCLLLGHRRSRSRASFDDKHGRWISQCKRCNVLLVRENGGKWRRLPAPSGKLVPIERESSAASDRSPGEAPFVAAGASDAANGGGPPAAEHGKQAVKFTAP
jgi:hypothetical protein